MKLGAVPSFMPAPVIALGITEPGCPASRRRAGRPSMVAAVLPLEPRGRRRYAGERLLVAGVWAVLLALGWFLAFCCFVGVVTVLGWLL